MSHLENAYKKNISSDKLWRQILGALLQWNAKSFWTFILGVAPLSLGVSAILSSEPLTPFLMLLSLDIFVWLIIKVCRTLTEIYSLNRNENGITTCQILILAAMGLWLIGFVIIFDEILLNAQITLAFGVISALLGWIFQDKVKGVIAFIHLRRNHLINIGDWIQVPRMGVDGEIRKVTLTTITLYNWDTTTSTFPVCILQSEPFNNLQNMAEGKTYGREMIKNFIVDASKIRPVTKNEIFSWIDNSCNDIHEFLPASEIQSGVLNAHLFRIYLHHWLMNNPSVSHKPRLLVRWLEPRDCGMVLQVNAFITDSNLSDFEWIQSQIIEHIVRSMGWFGLQLYQRPSASDMSGEVFSKKDIQTFNLGENE